MGNYEQLKEAIKAVIKTNGKQEITGQVMQDTLLAITSSFGQGALFAGIATPETNPLTPDQNVFYLAAQSGVYPNFNSLSVADGEIVVFSLSNGQWAKQILSLGGGGSVTTINEPDEEDLTTVPQTAEKNVIRFKNRAYDEANASGKGYKILRKYWKEVNGVRKNILTQDIINDANTIYEIRYDFDLNGAEIQIKEGCVLNFVGGSFRNGIIIGHETNVKTIKDCIFYNITLKSGFVGTLYYNMYINEANNEIGEFKKLKRYIKDCYNNNIEPCFSGINKITLEYDNEPIEVLEGKVLDFNNITIECKNNNYTGFFIKTVVSPFIDITDEEVKSNLKTELENSTTLNDTFIQDGKNYIICIKDENAWSKRINYNFTHYREDIILISNKLIENKPISTYNNDYSNPTYKYREVTNNKTVIKNINFIRSRENNKKVYLLGSDGLNNLEISNIVVHTINKKNLTNDALFFIENCTNVLIKDCVIYNIYDYSGYGYGFSLNNIYNFVFQNNKTYNNKWGVFGNNNMNRVTINNCDINRFDTHCYCKDISFNRCVFKFKYNQFSSIYGDVIFNDCNFYSFRPCLIESSYNCYTPFDLYFYNCTFAEVPNLYTDQGFKTEINERYELKDKCLPNIYIYNCTISNNTYYIGNTKPFLVIDTDLTNPIIKRDYIKSITIDGLHKTKEKVITVAFSKVNIHTSENLSINIKNLQLANKNEYIKENIKYYYSNSINLDNINIDNNEVINIINIESSTLCIRPINRSQNHVINCKTSILYDFRTIITTYNINRYIFDCCIFHLNNVDDDDIFVFPRYSCYKNCLFYNNYYDKMITTPITMFQGCRKTEKQKRLHKFSFVSDELELDSFYSVSSTYNLDSSIRDLALSSQFIANETDIAEYGIKAINKIDKNKLYISDNNIIYTTNKGSGTFAEKPNDAPIGFSYFCTDKQSAEGISNGITIYYKGNNVWVDALGRVVE